MNDLRERNPEYFDWTAEMLEKVIEKHKGDPVARTLDEWVEVVFEYIGSGEWKEET